MSYQTTKNHSSCSLLTRKEVGQLLNLSLRSVDRLIAGRAIEYMAFGGAKRFTRAAVEAYMERSRHEAGPAA